MNCRSAVTAIAFHLFMNWDYLSASNVLAGMIALWVIMGQRAVANKIYGMDTLGFGDIKLMAVGGLWLGAEGIFMAMSVALWSLHAIFIVIRKNHHGSLGVNEPYGVAGRPRFYCRIIDCGPLYLRRYFDMSFHLVDIEP